MTTTARNVLKAFEELDPAERQQVAVEILRRSAGPAEIPDAAFDEVADQLFQGYDTEESSSANR